MQIQSLKPVLRTWDIPGTIDFYTEILGFECKAYDADWGWAVLIRNQVELMLSGPNEHEGDRSPCFTGSIYFVCDDIDELFDRIQTRVKVCYPIADFEYGMREFAIYDNNGYLLQFGKELENG